MMILIQWKVNDRKNIYSFKLALKITLWWKIGDISESEEEQSAERIQTKKRKRDADPRDDSSGEESVDEVYFIQSSFLFY